MKILQAYRRLQPFSDGEAWVLFRAAAIAEAVGWTLLIIGILCTRLPASWNQDPVHMAGATHGMLFIAYIIAVLALSPSLGWSLPRTFIAGLCSVPPYGSLVYEIWTAHSRNRQKLQRLSRSACYTRLLTSIGSF